MHRQDFQRGPCDDCGHASLCRRDGYACAAFVRWIGSTTNPGRWLPEQRCRPGEGIASTTTAPLAHKPARRVAPRPPSVLATRRDLFRLFDGHVPATPVPKRSIPWNYDRNRAGLRAKPSLCVAGETADRRTRPTVEPATRKVPVIEIAVEPHVENGERADARGGGAEIDAAMAVTSGHESIASQSAAESAAASSFVSADEVQRSSNVPREPKVTISDEVSRLTFAESMERHAREYLVKVLIAAGGVRVRAAELAGVKRQRFQGLIRRHGIKIAFDTKARGWRRSDVAR